MPTGAKETIDGNLWMGIMPGPVMTRVLVQDSPDQTLLRARLPHSPDTLEPSRCSARRSHFGAVGRCTAALAVEGPVDFLRHETMARYRRDAHSPPALRRSTSSSSRPSARERDRLDAQ